MLCIIKHAGERNFRLHAMRVMIHPLYHHGWRCHDKALAVIPRCRSASVLGCRILRFPALRLRSAPGTSCRAPQRSWSVRQSAENVPGSETSSCPARSARRDRVSSRCQSEGHMFKDVVIASGIGKCQILYFDQGQGSVFSPPAVKSQETVAGLPSGSVFLPCLCMFLFLSLFREPRFSGLANATIIQQNTGLSTGISRAMVGGFPGLHR